jgi:hypothetical protein
LAFGVPVDVFVVGYGLDFGHIQDSQVAMGISLPRPVSNPDSCLVARKPKIPASWH